MASCTLSASSQTSSKAESVFPFEFYDSPASVNAESLHVMNSADHSFDLSHCEITEAEKDGGGSLYDSDKKERARGQAEDNSIVSAVQLLGDGGYSLVTFPNIKPEDMDARGILKQSPLHSINGQDHLTKQQKFARSKVWVDINLPDNEISLLRIRRNLSFSDSSAAAAEPPTPPSPSPHSSSLASASIGRIFKGKAPATARGSLENGGSGGGRQAYRSTRTVVEVLRELDADIVALQDVKAEEEREMKPLSELAAALGMSYAFAERWAPEYGNAVLSRWPIKHWKVQKIFDDTDFRNV